MRVRGEYGAQISAVKASTDADIPLLHPTISAPPLHDPNIAHGKVNLLDCHDNEARHKIGIVISAPRLLSIDVCQSIPMIWTTSDHRHGVDRILSHGCQRHVCASCEQLRRAEATPC